MRTAAYDMYTQATHESGKNWSSIKTEYPNVQVKDFPPKVMQAMKAANDKLLKEHAAKDPLTKEIQNVSSGLSTTSSFVDRYLS